MSKINYKDFHKYIVWWQKQNKKNPWKFWTSEIYSYLIKQIRLEILEMKTIWKNSDDIVEYLYNLIGIEEDEMYTHL